MSLRISGSMGRVLRGGAVALVIKVSSAGLQFLMFLMLARVMGFADYGLFGFGFSLATILAAGGSFGQRMLAMRYLGIYRSERRPACATGVVRDGVRIVALGTALLSILAAAVLPLFQPQTSTTFLLVTAVFAVTLSLAEYFSFVLRSYAGMTLALAPRDVVWRLLVVLAVAPSLLGWLGPLDAAAGMTLVTVLLLATTLAQTLFHSATRPHALLRSPAEYERARWLRSAWGLWGTSFVQVAAPNLAVVLLGLLIAPEETGPIFAALRIALLLNLFLLSANMAAAPMISRLHHEGRFGELQRTCALISLAATIGALLMLVLLAFEGRRMLDLFGPGFGAGYGVLLIVSGAYVVNTMTGPVSSVLELCGHEGAAFRMITVTNIVALAAMPVAIRSFGPAGAAGCLAFAIVAWNLWAAFYARRNLGIDPSILGLVAPVRPA